MILRRTKTLGLTSQPRAAFPWKTVRVDHFGSKPDMQEDRIIADSDINASSSIKHHGHHGELIVVAIEETILVSMVLFCSQNLVLWVGDQNYCAICIFFWSWESLQGANHACLAVASRSHGFESWCRYAGCRKSDHRDFWPASSSEAFWHSFFSVGLNLDWIVSNYWSFNIEIGLSNWNSFFSPLNFKLNFSVWQTLNYTYCAIAYYRPPRCRCMSMFYHNIYI